MLQLPPGLSLALPDGSGIELKEVTDEKDTAPERIEIRPPSCEDVIGPGWTDLEGIDDNCYYFPDGPGNVTFGTLRLFPSSFSEGNLSN